MIQEDPLTEHSRVWHSVARYCVYVGKFSQQNIVAKGLPIKEAKRIAAEKTAESQRARIGAYYGVQLENTEEANAAVRSADIWSKLNKKEERNI